MAQWRHIPTKHKWLDDGMTPVDSGVAPRPQPSVSSAPVPIKPAEVVDALTDEEKLAAIKTEAALDTVLSFVPEKGEATAPEPKLEPVVTPTLPLWEAPTQELSPSGSAIYPDGRPVTNPNHLMLFLWKGAELVRAYTPDGWVSKLRRPDGRENPLSESMVDVLIRSGSLKEVRPGVFKGEQ